MEKQPNRNELAGKLKEIRNSDEENPEKAKAKAQGYLEAMQTTDKYKEDKESHLKEARYHRDLLDLKKNARKWLLDSAIDDEGRENIQKVLDAIDFFIKNGIYFAFKDSGRELDLSPLGSIKEYDIEAKTIS
jgi:predicted acylesterase/phospholipase RssA